MGESCERVAFLSVDVKKKVWNKVRKREVSYGAVLRHNPAAITITKLGLFRAGLVSLTAIFQIFVLSIFCCEFNRDGAKQYLEHKTKLKMHIFTAGPCYDPYTFLDIRT